MKQFFIVLVALTSLALVTTGCGEKTSTTKETTVSTPGGTTTVTEEKEFENTGENPPAKQP